MKTGEKHPRFNPYEHVALSPRTLEIVIAVCGALAVGLIVCGIAFR